MSEHITHIAVYEDLARIIFNDPQVCDAFKTCIKNKYDSGLLASGTRGNHKYSIPILDKYKDKWESVKDDRQVQIQIAYAIGWLTHRAADRRLKLVFAEAEDDPNPLYTNDNCRIYQDAITFSKVYAGGKKPCLSPRERISPATFDYNLKTHPAAISMDVPKGEPLFTRLWQADMIRKHVFLDQEKDFAKWVDTFVYRYQYMTEDMRRYEEAFHNPDPQLMKRFYDEDNYYNDSDDIILYVRAIQDGQKSPGDLENAVYKAKEQSLYAQSLRQGVLYIRGASDYFTGKTDINGLQQILDKRIS